MRRGMTLLELMLAGGLLALLLTVTLSFLIPSLGATSRGALRVDLQQRASLAVESAVEDLQRSTPSSIWIFDKGVCLQRLDGFTSGGMQVWEARRVSYHWDADHCLRRELSEATEQPVAPSLTDFQKLVNQPGGSEKVLAYSVRQFRLSWAGRAVQITLELVRQKERFELHRNVFLRNG